MKVIYSLYLFCFIQVQRVLDHAWRRLTGFPTLKRSVITPSLYLGGQYHIKSISLLKKLGITGIISMRMRDVYRKDMLFDFHLLHLPTPDRHAPTMQQLEEGISFIDNEIKHKGKVYIHCHFGEGRGPTMALAYLIYSGMTYDDAVALVKQARTFISPTKQQVARLKEFERWVQNKNKH